MPEVGTQQANQHKAGGPLVAQQSESEQTAARPEMVAAAICVSASPIQSRLRLSGKTRRVLKNTEPDTYLETSASAMFLYGMVESRNLGLLEVPYEETITKAWAGLAKQIGAEGRVLGVSAGTGPSDKAQYVARDVGTYTWGTGAFLLAACAYAEQR